VIAPEPNAQPLDQRVEFLAASAELDVRLGARLRLEEVRTVLRDLAAHFIEDVRGAVELARAVVKSLTRVIEVGQPPLVPQTAFVLETRWPRWKRRPRCSTR